MSSVPAANHATLRPEEPGEPALRPPLGMATRIIRETLGAWGARIGAVWIGLLVVLAVLAPFLANGMPLLMKSEGRWSTPCLRYFQPADAILPVMAAVSFGLWLERRRLKSWDMAIIFLGALLVTCVVAVWWLHPPEAVRYATYRRLQAAGKIEFAVYAPIRYSPEDHVFEQSFMALHAPSPWFREIRSIGTKHWMGTDVNQADLLAVLIHASRIALAIGFVATGIAMVIGVTVGGLMGYFAGVVDIIGMRLVEIIEAIPRLFLLIAIVAFMEKRNIYVMMAVIGLTSWSGYTRFVRAEFLKLRHQDFVLAARACGLPLRSILFRHMLPNGVAPVLVSASFGVASAILAESTLSFLGLGLTDGVSWGTLLNQALGSAGTFTWWIALYPGLAIFLTVFAYVLIGESLRDAIDPHSKKTLQL